MFFFFLMFLYSVILVIRGKIEKVWNYSIWDFEVLCFCWKRWLGDNESKGILFSGSLGFLGIRKRIVGTPLNFKGIYSQVSSALSWALRGLELGFLPVLWLDIYYSSTYHPAMLRSKRIQIMLLPLSQWLFILSYQDSV